MVGAVKKNYIGIVRDQTGSMSGLKRAATDDYNSTIQGIREAALSGDIDTIINVMKCGVGTYGRTYDRAKNIHDVMNSSVSAVRSLAYNDYDTNGGETPLFDAVGELIEIMEKAPDIHDPNVTFLVLVITDGEDNSSSIWKTKIGEKMRKLQSTDRWTFLFRVPKGYGSKLSRTFGIPEGNIYEWSQTEKGFQDSTNATKAGFQTYYSGLSKGVTSTGKFFVNLNQINQSDVEVNLVDISNKTYIYEVYRFDSPVIKDFMESKTGRPYQKGSAFYQLVKAEDVQDGKSIAIRGKSSGKIYSGVAARRILGLPLYGKFRVQPSGHSDYEVYVQSTSLNRKLPLGTKVLYIPTGTF